MSYVAHHSGNCKKAAISSSVSVEGGFGFRRQTEARCLLTAMYSCLAKLPLIAALIYLILEEVWSGALSVAELVDAQFS